MRICLRLFLCGIVGTHWVIKTKNCLYCRNFKISISLISGFQKLKFRKMILVSFLSINQNNDNYGTHVCTLYTLMVMEEYNFRLFWHCVNFKGIVTFQVKYSESFGTCHASLLIPLQSHISFVSSLFFRHRLVLIQLTNVAVACFLLRVYRDGRLAVFYRIEQLIFKALHVPSRRISVCKIGSFNLSLLSPLI